MTRQTTIKFPNGEYADLTEGILSGSMKLSEILSDSEDLNYGDCNANKFEISLLGTDDLTGLQIQVVIVETSDSDVDTTYSVFTGTVDSCDMEKGGIYRKLVAYDAIYTCSNVDVMKWYNEFFPTQLVFHTVKEFRNGLFTYLGWTQQETTLINDNSYLRKNLTVDKLLVSDVLKSLCQINAVFGNIAGDGTFEYIQLYDTSLIDVTSNYKESSTYSLYRTAAIDTVEVVLNGVTTVKAGEGTELYQITDNFLLLELPDSIVLPMVQNILTKISTVTYVPADPELIVSDLTLHLGNKITCDSYSTYILQNELSGVQLFNQKISSKGNQTRQEAKDSAAGSVISEQTERNTSIGIYEKDTAATLVISTEQVSLGSVTITNLSNSIPIIMFTTEVLASGVTAGSTVITFDVTIAGAKNELCQKKITIHEGYNLITFMTFVEINLTGATEVGVVAICNDSAILNIDTHKSKLTVFGAGLLAVEVSSPMLIFTDFVGIDINDYVGVVFALKESCVIQHGPVTEKPIFSESVGINVNDYVGVMFNIVDNPLSHDWLNAVVQYAILDFYKMSSAILNAYLTISNNYVTMKTDYNFASSEQTIDSGKMVSLQLNMSQFSSVESVVISLD